MDELVSWRRPLLVAMAALLIVAAVAVPAQARPTSAAQDNDARPNILVVMTDDMSATDVKLMPNVQAPARGQGDDVRRRGRLVPALLPGAGDLHHRPVRPQPRRRRQLPPLRLVRDEAARQHPSGLAPGRRVQDGSDRQVAERLRGSRRPRRGAEGVRHLARPARRLRLRLLQLRHESRRQAALLGRRRVRPQAGRVREHRGDPRDRGRRRRLRQARGACSGRGRTATGARKSPPTTRRM